jgi:hypothetical protein
MTKGDNLGFRFFVHCFMEWPELVRSIDLTDTPGFVSKSKRLRISITYFSKATKTLTIYKYQQCQEHSKQCFDIVERTMIK